MKKIFLILTIIITSFAMTGCLDSGKNTESYEEVKTPPQTTESTTTKNNSSSSNESDTYADLLTQYSKALKEKWGGSDLNMNDMSLMMLDCYGSDPQKNIGYTLLDLDNDKSKELIIATTDAISDDYYGKLIFDVYTLNKNGSPIKVLTSTDRNRYYYAGENKFANIGSNSAGDAIETTVKMANGKLTDTGSTTASTSYKQLQLTLIE